MEKKINLIPNDLAVPPQTVKLTKTISKITTIGTIVVIVLVVVLTSVFMFIFIEHKNLTIKIDESKARIVQLEKSEQQLILVKDRLQKISTIKSYPSVEDDVLNFFEVMNLIGNASGSALVDANITDIKTDFSVSSSDSSSLASFLEPITQLTKFKSIILTSLGFGSNSGFISDLTLQHNE